MHQSSPYTRSFWGHIVTSFCALVAQKLASHRSPWKIPVPLSDQVEVKSWSESDHLNQPVRSKAWLHLQSGNHSSLTRLWMKTYNRNSTTIGFAAQSSLLQAPPLQHCTAPFRNRPCADPFRNGLNMELLNKKELHCKRIAKTEVQ